MAAPSQRSACCVSSYGSFCVSPSSYPLPTCKMEASLSPSSSHSSLSLEPHLHGLPSPSHSSSCLPDSPYSALLSSSYSHIPSLLDAPSPLSLHLSNPPSPSSFKKRPASFLSELGESPPFDVSAPMAPKRICQPAALDGTNTYRIRETSSALLDNALPTTDHSNELLDGAIWRMGCAENVASGDLDDVLDLLLQEAEVAPIASLSAQSPLGCHGRPLLAYKLDHGKGETQEVFSGKLDYCKEESKELCTKASNSNEYNHLASLARGTRTWSDTLQDLIRGQTRTESDGGAAMQELQTEVKVSFCDQELKKQMAPIAKQEKMGRNEEDEEKEEERLQQNQSGIAKEQEAARPLRASSGRWAGPTLLDIESALAMTSPPSTTTYPFGNILPATPSSSFLCSIRDILKQDPPSARVLGAFAGKEELNLEQDDDKLSTWRRLQKRNQMEPRYTVKIRCEEDAVNDGYRWRKYGQKSIKNSPYPRSYYRCSSGKCNVKKQVERSGEDAGLLLVSYEGIHLHHRPSSLLSHTCPSPSHV